MALESDPEEREAWLILLRTPGVGAATVRNLVRRYGGARPALAAVRREPFQRTDGAAARAWLRAPDAERLRADHAWLALPGHALLCCTDADFPPLLHEMPSPPAALFVAGDATALWRPQVAVVGSRRASQAGFAHARGFTLALAEAGFAITSGLAEGIDATAHEAALDAGAFTLAILGTGPDRIYPRRNGDLAARVRAQGALVSEFPPGTEGHPTHFPRRNRIIAGLSLGTLVIEAGLKSGSLITARNAAESGREIYAVPGSIHDPLARGCHQLIREGARLVESAAEIIAELAPRAQTLCGELRAALPPPAAPDAGNARSDADATHAAILGAIGHEAVGLDQLAGRTALTVAALSSVLLMLELDGAIVARGDGTYARRV